MPQSSIVIRTYRQLTWSGSMGALGTRCFTVSLMWFMGGWLSLLVVRQCGFILGKAETEGVTRRDNPSIIVRQRRWRIRLLAGGACYHFIFPQFSPVFSSATLASFHESPGMTWSPVLLASFSIRITAWAELPLALMAKLEIDISIAS